MTVRPLLIVAVGQVAMLRAARQGRDPDPVHFALQAELAGASGIWAHLRLDRRYLTEDDVSLLSRLVKTQFYLQVSPHQDILHLVNGLRPQNLALAAERRDERAAESGLDVSLLANDLKGVIGNIDNRQTKVFLFVEPDLDQIKAAAKLQADGVAINARELAASTRATVYDRKLKQMQDAVRLSAKYGLKTHIAHGVNAEIIHDLAIIPNIDAIHVGHHLTALALQVGVVGAVKRFLELMKAGP